tara:strand:- start:28 stop:537 length:510 start_codon:yes stop_codon:yes gene_type:complete
MSFFNYSLSSAPKDFFSNPEFGKPKDMGSITPKFKGGSTMKDAFKGGDDNKFSRMAGAFGGMLQKAGGFKPYDEDKEYMKSLMNRPFGGGAIPGSTQRLAGGLTMSLPPAFEPIITPGGGGGYQGRSTGQRIAGVAGGALSGAAAGSAIAPGIGTAIGAGIGALGGLFG